MFRRTHSVKYESTVKIDLLAGDRVNTARRNLSRMQRRLLTLLLLLLSYLVTGGGGRLIDGIFTEPTLEPGYSLVASIPRGASALNVTELRHTQNYLAVRLHDGTFLLNGNYSINWSGEYEAAGTKFIYHRQSPQHLESFAAVGPLLEPIDVMVLYQEPNPGIVYRYVIPGNVNAVPSSSGISAATGKTSEIAPPISTQLRRIDGTSSMVGDEAPPPSRRFRRRKFAWKAIGLTDCSKSCGGGVQTMRFICIREHSQMQVHEKRCHTLEKPSGTSLRCNVRPCPAKWRSGPWSECSVTCGNGVRNREMECVQEVNSLLTLRVADGACLEPKTLPVTEPCSMPACEDSRSKMIQQTFQSAYWNVGAWSQCSTSCGPGKRTRTITCITKGWGTCAAEEKPVVQEACDLEPCLTKPSTTNAIPMNVHGSPWLFTEWSQQCSTDCGTGIQSRRILCSATQKDESCDESDRPVLTRTCSNDKTCSGQWFTGPWTQCSSICDFGEQTRDAVCVTTLHGSLRVVLDMNCPANRPEIRRSCRGPPCSSAWFTSDWTQCTRSCGKGMQKREVRCLGPNGQPPKPDQTQCKDEERPASRRACNEHSCKMVQDVYGPDNSQRVVQVQNDPEVPNGLDEDPMCKDSFSNCNLVTQARLCSYQFYQKSCCLSCSRAKLENE